MISSGDIREFAEKVFGEPFEADSIITEDRLTPAEFLPGKNPTDFTIPTQEQIDALKPAD
jgi:DEAD/DEAH box helicase domain-containing protein